MLDKQYWTAGFYQTIEIQTTTTQTAAFINLTKNVNMKENM